MANATSVQDLRDDILERGGEATDGSSTYTARALEYLNRSYMDSWFARPWPWTVKHPPTIVNLVAPITNRLVSATNGSTAINFDAAITPSVQERKILIGNAWYRIAQHTSNSSGATLDGAFQEASITNSACVIYQDEYEVTASDFARLARIFDPRLGNWIEPVRTDHAAIREQLTTPTQGDPYKFAMLTDTRFILDYYPQDARRLEVHYQFFPADLTVGGNDPDWPRWRRWMLEERALFYLFMDKNDDRATVADQLWRDALDAMTQEYGSQTPARGYVRNVETIV